MATSKKSSKAVTKKTTAPKKTTAKRVATKRTTPKKAKNTMPGGYLMYAFLIIATAAAIIAIAGIILENGIEPGENLASFEPFFTFIKQCKSVALGIFGVFLVLACFTKMNKK